MTETDYINLIVRILNQITDKIGSLDSKIDTLLSQNSKKPDFINLDLWNKKIVDNVELCEMLYVTKRTLWRYRKEKVLHYFRLKKLYYYKMSDVIMFLENYHNSNK